jgi:hypothetical protein
LHFYSLLYFLKLQFFYDTPLICQFFVCPTLFVPAIPLIKNMYVKRTCICSWRCTVAKGYIFRINITNIYYRHYTQLNKVRFIVCQLKKIKWLIYIQLAEINFGHNLTKIIFSFMMFLLNHFSFIMFFLKHVEFQIFLTVHNKL